MTNIKYIILEQIISEGRLEDVIKKYSDVSEEIIRHLSQNDPSGNNKYLEWMVKNSGAGIEEVVDAVNCFHSNLNRLSDKVLKQIYGEENFVNPSPEQVRELQRIIRAPKDINSYASHLWVKPMCEYFEENVPTNEERVKVWENSKWLVVSPLTHKASCKYGIHSNWCVSTSNPDYFGRYTRDGILLFWLDKQQMHPTRGEEVGKYKLAVNIKFDRPNNPLEWDWYSMSDQRLDSEFMLTVMPLDGIEVCKKYMDGILNQKSSGVMGVLKKIEPYTIGMNKMGNDIIIIPRIVGGKLSKEFLDFFNFTRSRWSDTYSGSMNRNFEDGDIVYIKVDSVDGVGEDGKPNNLNDHSIAYRNILNLKDGDWKIKKSSLIGDIYERLGGTGNIDTQAMNDWINKFIEGFNSEGMEYRESVRSTELKPGDYIEYTERGRYGRADVVQVTKVTDKSVSLSNGKKTVRTNTNWKTRVTKNIKIVDDTVNESRWIRKRII